MRKRLDKAYANYKKRYKAKQKLMREKGLEMESRMLKKKEYLSRREEMVKYEGITTNINQTLVQEQQYKYSQRTARHLKSFAKEHGLETGKLSISAIRQGQGLPEELIRLNEELKEQGLSGKERQEYISYEVFGSE